MRRWNSILAAGKGLATLTGLVLVLVLAPSADAVAGEPVISNTSTGFIGARNATFHATVDPNGLDTDYEFILSIPCPEAPPGGVTCEAITSVPLGPDETIPASEGPRNVSLRVSSGGYALQPGTEYGWTVRAENTAGVQFSLDEEFVTSVPPKVNAESATGITETSATLNAQIVPGVEGFRANESPQVAAYYQFQLAQDPSEFRPEIGCPDLSEFEGTSIGCLGSLLAEMNGGGESAGPFQYEETDLPFETLFGQRELIASGPSGDFYGPPPAQGVSLDLAEVERQLEPSTTYHYRVVAVLRIPGEDKINWEAPPVYGPDQTFTTGPFTEDPNGTPPTANPTDSTSETQSQDTSQTAQQINSSASKKKCQRRKRHEHHRSNGDASKGGKHSHRRPGHRSCKASP